MPKIADKIKSKLRPAKNMIFAGAGFAYDYFRFIKHCGWRKGGPQKRDYRAVKIYHRLEKSLSFKNQKQGGGLTAATDLLRHFHESDFEIKDAGFQERVGIKVLHDFTHHFNGQTIDIAQIKEFCSKSSKHEEPEGGVLQYSAQLLQRGVIENPEDFFMSRYSVRSFSQQPIEQEKISRAIQLAMKSPSVCSRQAWHVYHLYDRKSIDAALSLQNGNKGFGHEIPCLLIITADLQAFDTASERYQHWIDGGMFSMSIVYTLHALGLGSCCLNWSKGPTDDLKIRKKLGLQDAHSIIMMLAVGYPAEEFMVCSSARRPLSEVYTPINI